MPKYLQSIKNYFFIDNISLFQLLILSLSFPKTYKYLLPLLLATSVLHFYKYKKKILSEKLITHWYFLLLIYSLIFFRSTHTLILAINILINVYFLITNKKVKYVFNFKLEKLIASFFFVIFINQLLFKPYLRGLDTYLYLFFYPLLFVLLKKNNAKIDKIKCMNIFILSVLISSIELFFINFYEGKISLKTNTFFAESLDLTHVYYGMYLSVACLFLLITFNKKKVFTIIKWLSLLLFFVLILHIGARMSLLAIITVSAFYCYLKLKNKNWLKLGIPFLLIVCISLVSYKTIPRVKEDLLSIKKVYVSVKTNDKEDIILNSWRNIYQRFLVTKYAIEKVKENFIFGIGIHNVKEKLGVKIYNDGYKYFQPLNSHNQYLDFLLGLGFFGFLYFIFILLQIILSNEKNIYFILFFIIVMLTESILFRVKGISIFFLFTLLFSLKTRFNND